MPIKPRKQEDPSVYRYKAHSVKIVELVFEDPAQHHRRVPEEAFGYKTLQILGAWVSKLRGVVKKVHAHILRHRGLHHQLA
jgi:hypothetical protein